MVVNVLLAFPPLVLIIAMVAYPGQALVKVIVALGIVFTPAVVRIARANTLRLSELEFVTAARAAGMGDARIILRELLPNLVPALLAYALLLVAVGALAEAGLSFLGLGVPPGTPSLGEMLAQGKNNIDAWWISLSTFCVLVLTLLLLTFMGDALRDALDPRKASA